MQVFDAIIAPEDLIPVPENQIPEDVISEAPAQDVPDISEAPPAAEEETPAARSEGADPFAAAAEEAIKEEAAEESAEGTEEITEEAVEEEVAEEVVEAVVIEEIGKVTEAAPQVTETTQAAPETGAASAGASLLAVIAAVVLIVLVGIFFVVKTVRKKTKET